MKIGTVVTFRRYADRISPGRNAQFDQFIAYLLEGSGKIAVDIEGWRAELFIKESKEKTVEIEAFSHLYYALDFFIECDKNDISRWKKMLRKWNPESTKSDLREFEKDSLMISLNSEITHLFLTANLAQPDSCTPTSSFSYINTKNKKFMYGVERFSNSWDGLFEFCEKYPAPLPRMDYARVWDWYL